MINMLTTVKNFWGGNVNKTQLNAYDEIPVELRRSNIVAFSKKQVVKKCYVYQINSFKKNTGIIRILINRRSRIRPETELSGFPQDTRIRHSPFYFRFSIFYSIGHIPTRCIQCFIFWFVSGLTNWVISAVRGYCHEQRVQFNI